MIIRIRSRDGLERVTLSSPAPTVADLAYAVQSQLGVPTTAQSLSLDSSLLLPNAPPPRLLSDPSLPLSAAGLAHGAVVFLSYPDGARFSSLPLPPKALNLTDRPRSMTVADLVARQIRVTRQEAPRCASASFDRDAAHAFQLYASETLAFAVKRGGFLYGTVDEDKNVLVDFIYEPPQQGSQDALLLMRDSDEEVVVDTIAAGLRMRRVGFVLTEAVGRKPSPTGEYTLSSKDVLLAAQLQAESGLDEWVTAVVKLVVGEDGAGVVHFEAFQMSDVCVKLFKDGVFEMETGDDDDPRLSKMKKEVIAGGKDTMEVDNDFFLVPVKISDHQGLLSAIFPIENRGNPVTMRALKNHLDRTKNLPFVKRLSDFHLLLWLARFLDVKSDIPALSECIQKQSSIPEGYQLLIESLAASS